MERAGWDSIWLDDHLLSDEGAWEDPLEGWAALSAVASVTSRARLGLLVSSATFRNPGLIAKLATTLDHPRAVARSLGLGGGWFDREHEAFGIDFGSGFGERLDRLDEAAMLIRRLLDGAGHPPGRFFEMHDALSLPKAVRSRLPILIGGSGKQRTLRTTATYADLWNGYGDPRSHRRGLRRAADPLRGGRPPFRGHRSDGHHPRRRPGSGSGGAEAWSATAERHGLIGRLGSDGTDRGLTAVC